MQLSDLDELVLSVRDRVSRSYVLEAVNAHRAGAQRAAITSTWIAVVFDLISKIRELAEQGDRNATAIVSDLDKAIAKGVNRDAARARGERRHFPHTREGEP